MTFRYQTDPVDENEAVLGVFYGNRGQWGAQFVVTNRRLLLGPLDVGLAEIILDKGGVPDVEFVKSILSQYAPSNPKTIWLRHVVDVQPTNNASLFRAPGVSLRTDTDEEIKLAIVHSPKAMNRNPGNTTARDRFVSLLRGAIDAAKAASPAA